MRERRTRSRTYAKLAASAVFLFVAFAAIGAKCIENETLYRDASGDWHIVGEIHNETEVQGVEMLLKGTLFDANGNVLAEGQTGTCPLELSPNSFSTFDIEFHNSSAVPQPASYKVQAIGGRAIDAPLPPLDVTLSNLEAQRTGDDVTLTGTVRANTHYPGLYLACAAFYNAAGEVIREFIIFGLGELPANVNQPLELPLPVDTSEAVSMRFWLTGPGSEPLESDYRSVMSDLIPID